MALKVKKRKKSGRMRGSHTHGRGGKKKARGSGHQGGVGMAGAGKRADQKKTLVLNLYGNNYFGKSKALRRKQKIKLKEINLRDIEIKFKDGIEIPSNLVTLQSGISNRHSQTTGNKINGNVYKEIDLKGYKILGDGDIKGKYKITTSQASKSAMEKVKKTGGEIILQ